MFGKRRLKQRNRFCLSHSIVYLFLILFFDDQCLVTSYRVIGMFKERKLYFQWHARKADQLKAKTEEKKQNWIIHTVGFSIHSLNESSFGSAITFITLHCYHWYTELAVPLNFIIKWNNQSFIFLSILRHVTEYIRHPLWMRLLNAQWRNQ